MVNVFDVCLRHAYHLTFGGFPLKVIIYLGRIGFPSSACLEEHINKIRGIRIGDSIFTIHEISRRPIRSSNPHIAAFLPEFPGVVFTSVFSFCKFQPIMRTYMLHASKEAIPTVLMSCHKRRALPYKEDQASLSVHACLPRPYKGRPRHSASSGRYNSVPTT